jgi:hypothetical protein
LRISISRWRRLTGQPIAFIGLLSGLEARGQIGLFEGQADIGAVLHPGSAEYDTGDGHRKAVLMIRQSLDRDSALRGRGASPGKMKIYNLRAARRM